MCRCSEMLVFVTLIFLASCPSASTNITPTCPPNLFSYTSAGKPACCSYCGPGTYMGQPCNTINKTTCHECTKGTYTDKANRYRGCYDCLISCPENMVFVKECTKMAQAKCKCHAGHYERPPPAPGCNKCDDCKPGFGITIHCSDEHNRVCDRCKKGETFADKENMKCSKCKICQLNQIRLANCTLTKDVVCEDVSLHRPPPPTKGTKVSTSMIFTIVSVIVVCLVIIFCSIFFGVRRFTKSRCRRLCRESPDMTRTSLERRHEARGSSEEEIPFSVRVDLNGQVEDTGQSSISEMLIQNVNYNTKEEIAKLLDPKILFGKNWRSLAGKMNYNQVDIEGFAKDESPTLRLFMEYGTQESPNVKKLCTMLKEIRRHDAAKLLEECLKSSSTDV